MADPIEELLKQIQQSETARLPFGGTAKQPPSVANSVPSSPSPDLPLPTEPSKPKPIDHLLAEIEGKPMAQSVPALEESLQCGHDSPSEVVKSARSSNPQSVDALLSQLDSTVKNSPPSQPPILPYPSQIQKGEVAPSQSRPTRSKPNPPKPEPQTAKPVSPANPQTEKQKRRQAIERRAQEWLQNLDPHGGEAHFFETLAEKYPSRLEAAIDFLGLEQE